MKIGWISVDGLLGFYISFGVETGKGGIYMKKMEEKILENYLPLIKKEVAKFESSTISRDELMSEAYYIMIRAMKAGRHELPGFPAYIKKSIDLGLLRYVLREKKKRWGYEINR